MPGYRDRKGLSQPQHQGDDEKHRRLKQIAEKLKGTPSKYQEVEKSRERKPEEFSTLSETEQLTLKTSQLVAKIEFTPVVLKDCWRQVLEELQNPQEVLTLRNASALFNDAYVILTTRKNAALWSLAIPILLQSGTLSHKGALASRVVNQEVKAAVDDALINIQPSWMNNAYIFSTVNDTQRFLSHFDRAAGNPFISKQIDIHVSDAATFERSVELLTHFGHCLHTLNFGMDITQPFSLVKLRVAQILALIPNVKSLKIGLRGFEPEVNPLWIFAMTDRRRMPLLPSLNSLTTLEVYRISNELLFPDDFIRNILVVYGGQLIRCVCDYRIFNEFFQAPFVNLRHLELSRFHRGVPDQRIIINTGRLRLESLYLSGDTIPYNNSTVLLLNQVRATLVELRMDQLRNESGVFQMDPSILQQFPKLKRLTVCASSLINSGLWYVFRHQFLNLEHLRFESRDQRRIPDGPAPNADNWDGVFSLFHKLETITWVVGGSELLFKRW